MTAKLAIVKFYLGLCLPKSCTEDELNRLEPAFANTIATKLTNNPFPASV